MVIFKQYLIQIFKILVKQCYPEGFRAGDESKKKC